MIVAFCLYKYFPFGGLQRDFMRIAQTVAARGHHVRVYTQSWEGECPDVFELVWYRLSPRQTMVAMRSIIAWVQAHLLRASLSIGSLDSTKCRGWIVYHAAGCLLCREKGRMRERLSSIA